MEVKTETSPFGSPTRTRVLLVIHALGDSYAREMARILVAPLSVVQKAIYSLERDGIIAARSVGRTRLFRIDPRYFAASEVRSLLDRLAEPNSDLRVRIGRLRRRP